MDEGTSNLDRMFTDVNQKTSEIAGQVGQTPQGWNGSIFNMIEGLSNSVIMPIAGIIIPGVRKTTRYQMIEVEYLDMNWKKQKLKLDGWTAQICQHELDHLEGILI